MRLKPQDDGGSPNMTLALNNSISIEMAQN
jgi:hypothetical protein